MPSNPKQIHQKTPSVGDFHSANFFYQIGKDNTHFKYFTLTFASKTIIYIMLYPYLTFFTGTPNQTSILFNDTYTMIKLPNYDVKNDKNFHWIISSHWYLNGMKDDIQYKHEGFDKIGYLQLTNCETSMQVHFIPKNEKCPPPKVSVACLMSRFAFFLRKHVKVTPREIKLTI